VGEVTSLKEECQKTAQEKVLGAPSMNWREKGGAHNEQEKMNSIYKLSSEEGGKKHRYEENEGS